MRALPAPTDDHAARASLVFKARCARFLEEYFKDFNGTRAWARAFGESRMGALRATQMLKHPFVRAEIERLRQGRMALADITAERVIMELARIGFADMRKLVRETQAPDGSIAQYPIPLAQIDEDTARALSEITYMPNGSVRVKLESKLPALATLARITGAIPEERRGFERGASAGALGARTGDYESCDDEEIARLIEACADASHETIEDVDVYADDDLGSPPDAPVDADGYDGPDYDGE